LRKDFAVFLGYCAVKIGKRFIRFEIIFITVPFVGYVYQRASLFLEFIQFRLRFSQYVGIVF